MKLHIIYRRYIEGLVREREFGTDKLFKAYLISHCAIHFQLFAYAAQEHSKKYGSTFEQCAKISYKNHKHSVHNRNACLRKEIPFKGITHSKMICKPITFAMSAPTADGSAAAVVCSKEFMKSYQMQVCCQ